MMSERSSSRNPFTPSQWQELEHQALIYKYMVSGMPIPTDLILPLRRSFLLDSTRFSPSFPFPAHAQSGWNCYQMGFGRRAEDPEPGRCRRTDGKKWRCSKEAFPDSKYCERHMHRGKNRSRKPVEISLATSTYTSSSSSSSSSSTHYPLPGSHPIPSPNTCRPLYPYSTTSRPSNLPPDSLSCSDNGSCRHASFIFPEASGTERENPLQLSFMADANQRSYSLSKEEEEERNRPLRHFFDECPRKKKGTWMDLEEEGSSYAKAQLSVPFPKWF